MRSRRSRIGSGSGCGLDSVVALPVSGDCEASSCWSAATYADSIVSSGTTCRDGLAASPAMAKVENSSDEGQRKKLDSPHRFLCPQGILRRPAIRLLSLTLILIFIRRGPDMRLLHSCLVEFFDAGLGLDVVRCRDSGRAKLRFPSWVLGELPLYLKGFAGIAGVDQAFRVAAPNTRGRVII